MTTTTAPLPTRNEAWGFFGTIASADKGLNVDTYWQEMSRQILEDLDATNGYEAEGVRDFLDSRDGRHLADEVVGILHREPGLTPRQACHHARARYARHKIDWRTERLYGIPRGLPLITGWVYHYAIEAECHAAGAA